MSRHLRHAVLLALLSACSSPKPKGPQDIGVTSRAYVGESELLIRYRYEPQTGKEVVLHLDAEAKRGAPGAVRLSLKLDGFSVVRGEPTWETKGTGTHKLTLRAVDSTPSVTVVTHHIERDVELASDEIRFWVDDEGVIAECFPGDKACE